MVDLDPLLSARQTARVLGVHLNTVHRMIHDGELPAFKVKRDWRVRRQDLAAYIEKRLYEAAGRPE